ncbi:MAG: D-glycero-beta-D-manno-heptose 1-phosphate adenylyltransferase [Bacteroidales bacterium]|nr:D-glycero-beta-D-manno-heptose 1-phosphate adenylyltransferase [Bacteroidales bacterium]
MNHSSCIENKIYPVNADLSIVEQWRKEGKRLVFTNGCFDLVHRGHLVYLAQAAEKGDKLIIGLNSDASVRCIKGEHRPVTDEYSRAYLLASLFFVDAVILFDELTPYELIQRVQPDVLVKGSDYKPEDIVGADIVLAKGGEVTTIHFLPGYSTTSIIEKIQQEKKQ